MCGVVREFGCLFGYYYVVYGDFDGMIELQFRFEVSVMFIEGYMFDVNCYVNDMVLR